MQVGKINQLITAKDATGYACGTTRATRIPRAAAAAKDDARRRHARRLRRLCISRSALRRQRQQQDAAFVRRQVDKLEWWRAGRGKLHAAGARMSDTATEIELKAEDLQKYLEVAASVAEELSDFLATHHLEITRAHHTPNAWGESLTMPLAYQDPQYAGRVHNLKIACDSFINIMRGNL
jgi:hypothetical protein